MSRNVGWGEYLTRGVPTKRFLIGGNWKCNGSISSLNEVVDMLNNSGAVPVVSEVVIAVPSIHIAAAQLQMRREIAIAAQDVGAQGMGAYTGEVSAGMLLDAGVLWTLAGHSERRIGFGMPGETPALVARKAQLALAAGMSVILCIGETLADREAGKTLAVCIEMLAPCVEALKETDWRKVVVAYEPVWAIGTGKVATPLQAEETHRDIRAWLAAQSKIGARIASDIRIIYGGSVKASNCKELIACPNIDGFLVGGASLLPEFVDIIRSPLSL